jgi:predicted lysophospholipase L1 biosynthesis ABC-type transport system permease subunit
LSEPVRPALYVPFAQSPFGGAWIAVKANVDPQTLNPAITDVVRSVDPLMNPRDLQSMEEVVSDTMVRPRFQTWLLATFGGLALALAAVGIYGVVAYGVAQRTAEIGLRLALGATPSSVIGLVLGRGMIPVALGLATGVVGALSFSRLMASLLTDVSPTDPLTFVAVTMLLAAVAMAAAYVPALRAARLDPLHALRAE